MSNVNDVPKIEKRNDLSDKRRQPSNQIGDVESDGIRIEGRKDHWPSDATADDIQPKNGNKSVLL
jgi:hypothetical protein